MKKIRKVILRVYRYLFRPSEMESNFLRDMFGNIYDIEVGKYSYGCFDQTRFQGRLQIGRYCSFSRTCRRVNANHGVEYLSLHPYVYNAKLGLVDKEAIVRSKCVIEDDVWIGHNVVILPNVSKIGRGAIIAAGAIVTGDVEAYSIFAGVPARKIKSRFTPEQIALIEASEWWKLEKKQLQELIRQNPDIIYNPTKSLKGNSLI